MATTIRKFFTGVASVLVRALDATGIKFQNSSGTQIGDLTDAGASSWGPSAGGDIKHTANGSLTGKFGSALYNVGGQNAVETITLGANGTSTDAITITTAFGVGYQIIVSAMVAGNSAILFATYASATITELADPGTIVPGTLTVTKSANSYVFKIENATAGDVLIGVQVIGARISSAVVGT